MYIQPYIILQCLIIKKYIQLSINIGVFWNSTNVYFYDCDSSKTYKIYDNNNYVTLDDDYIDDYRTIKKILYFEESRLINGIGLIDINGNQIPDLDLSNTIIYFEFLFIFDIILCVFN